MLWQGGSVEKTQARRLVEVPEKAQPKAASL